jgi:putative FmdB family regulatory protein
MPLYEYKCDSCGATFELIQRFSDPPVEVCRVCGAPVHKVLSAPAIRFKGSGWYVTDYPKKGMTDAGKSSDDKVSSTTDSPKSPNASAPTPASTSTDSSAKKAD